jgi:hypothetical protein
MIESQGINRRQGCFGSIFSNTMMGIDLLLSGLLDL